MSKGKSSPLFTLFLVLGFLGMCGIGPCATMCGHPRHHSAGR